MDCETRLSSYDCDLFIFAVIGLALVPGLRKRGIIQKLTAKVTGAVAGLKRGQEKVGKTKTN